MNRRWVLTSLLLWGSQTALGQVQAQGFPATPALKLPLPTLPPFNAPVQALPSLPALPQFTPADLDPNAPALQQAAEETPGTDDPNYQLTHLYSLPDLRLGTLKSEKWPMLEVIDTARLATWNKTAAECRSVRAGTFQGGKTPPACLPFEWTVPISLASGAEDAATGLRRVWQRFEERYWWRAQTALNNETLLPLLCLAGVGGGRLSTTAVTQRTTVQPEDLPGPLRTKVATSTPVNSFFLDSYGLLPQVPPGEFCDQLPYRPTVMFIPGGCTYVLGVRTFCLSGNSTVTGPGVAPLYFNMGAATSRVEDAMSHAATVYYPEYQADALEELLPPKRASLFVLPWHSLLPGEGAMIAPVMNNDASLTQFHDLSRVAGNQLTGLYKLLSPLYYFQGQSHPRALDVLGLPGRKDLLGSPPTAWKFEEFKRTLAPTNPVYYDLFGYMNFFQTWNQFDTAVLPEPALARPFRTLSYGATAIDSYLDSKSP